MRYFLDYGLGIVSLIIAFTLPRGVDRDWFTMVSIIFVCCGSIRMDLEKQRK